MQYGKPGGGLAGGNAALAFTGFRSWLWAEVAVLLIVVGVILLRMAAMRRRQ